MVECIFNSNAENNDFNISNATSTTVLELSEAIWKKLNPDKEFSYVSDDPFEYDVQKRVPDVSKAKIVFSNEGSLSLLQILSMFVLVNDMQCLRAGRKCSDLISSNGTELYSCLVLLINGFINSPLFHYKVY